MRSTPLLFLGILAGMAASWWGVIVAPRLQLGGAPTVVVNGQHYPPRRPGLAEQGAEVYRAQGCNACHTQFLRPEGYGHDLDWGWGPRRTVAQDYLRDNPVLLGAVRVGPDLSNIGSRMGAGDTNVQPAMVAYQLEHLYHSRAAMPGSVMPAYPYLFEKRRIAGVPSPDALKLKAPYAPEDGYEVVPTPEARALMAYLLSLRTTISLPEAPIVPPPTNAVADAAPGTDAAVTNNATAK